MDVKATFQSAVESDLNGINPDGQTKCNIVLKLISCIKKQFSTTNSKGRITSSFPTR